MLKASDINLYIDGRQFLKVGNITVEPGRIVTLLGPSGSGKSTFLRSIAGLNDSKVTMTGHVSLEKLDLMPLPAHLRRVGYLDQRQTLFPHMSGAQNLAFGQRKPNPEELNRALVTSGMNDKRDHDVASLSGGEAARIALMRMLLSAPKAMLLDEPFAALDPQLRSKIRGFIFDQVRTRQLPVLLVTHDEEDAKAAGGEIYGIKNQEVAREA